MAAAQGLAVEAGQIELYDGTTPRRRALPPRPTAKLCAGCRAKEARYGFQHEAGFDPSAGLGAGRPNTLCFECFRMELDRRQRVAAQLARGWNAEQVRLPLADTLKELDVRRRRAQIAARHAIGA
jgi:hypothetical protein